MHYRKIWEEHNKQKIPSGYHIHHIDGDRSNNTPDNLLCVSPEEHFNIHLKQGDIVCLYGRFIQGASEAGKKGGKASGISRRGKKRNLSEATRKLLSEIAKKRKPYKRSDEFRRKLSIANTGEKNPMYGKKHTLETKLKISIKKKNSIPWNYGIKHTEETKNKIKKSREIFFENGGKSPFSNIYTVISDNGDILCKSVCHDIIENELNITHRQFLTIRKFCRTNPDRYHPKFNIKIISEGKYYARKNSEN